MQAASDQLLLRVLEQKHLLCPVCGYDLHRLTVPRCSECGHSLMLKVTLATPMMRWSWLVTLAAACMNAGLGIVIVLLAARGPGRDFHSARHHILPEGDFYDLAYYLEMLMVLSPVPVLIFRRAFQRLPLWGQVVLMAPVIVIAGLVFVGIAMRVR